MKIGHVGAGGTGKTTLAKLLADQLELAFIPSIVRDVLKERGITTEAEQQLMNPIQRYDLQKAILIRKLEKDWQHEGGVFDRTPIDHWAHVLYEAAETIPNKDYETLEAHVIGTTKDYDLVIYHPIPSWHQQMLQDGLRLPNPAYHTAIDAIIRGTLMRWKIRHFILPDGSPDQLTRSVLDRLQNNGFEYETEWDGAAPSGV